MKIVDSFLIYESILEPSEDVWLLSEEGHWAWYVGITSHDIYCQNMGQWLRVTHQPFPGAPHENR